MSIQDGTVCIYLYRILDTTATVESFDIDSVYRQWRVSLDTTEGFLVVSHCFKLKVLLQLNSGKVKTDSQKCLLFYLLYVKVRRAVDWGRHAQSLVGILCKTVMIKGHILLVLEYQSFFFFLNDLCPHNCLKISSFCITLQKQSTSI